MSRSPFAHRATRADAPPPPAPPPAVTPGGGAARITARRTIIAVTVAVVLIAGVVAVVAPPGNTRTAPGAAAASPDTPGPSPADSLARASAQSAALIALARESGYDRADAAAFARALASIADATKPALAKTPERAAALHRSVSKSLGKALVTGALKEAELRVAALPFADAREYRVDLWNDYDTTLTATRNLASNGDPVAAVKSARAATIKADAIVTGVRAALIKLADDMVAAGNTVAATAFHRKLARLTPAETASVDWLMRHGKPAGAPLRDALGIPFAYVPPGAFLRGSPPAESGRENDETRTRVTLSKGYYLGATEITQTQWDTVMGAGDAATRLAGEPSRFRGAELPMVNLTWEDTVLFCRKISARTGRRYRLPTEAEWEYAARAGTDALYGTGKLFLTARDAVVDDATAGAPDAPKPVASTGSANAWNLHDMHGNVWEWCADWYAPYPRSDSRDPTGPERSDSRSDTANKVARGGSWNDPASAARCANRWSNNPAVRVNYIGFRVLLEFDAGLE